MILPVASVMCASGVLRVLVAACVLMRQVLLEPDRTNYPTARRRLRWALVGVSLFLVYNGMELICRSFTRPATATLWSGFCLSVAWLVAEVLSLERVLRSWLPSRVQRRVQQLLHLASCRNRGASQRSRDASIAAVWATARPKRVPSSSVVAPALAELALAGAQVTGPDERPPISFADALREAFPPPADAGGVVPPGLSDL